MSGFVERASELLPSTKIELDAAMERLTVLRIETAAAEVDVARLRNLERSLDAVARGLPVIDEEEGGLVGWQIAHTAIPLMQMEDPAGVGLHYRKVWNLLEEAGHAIRSDDPESVVLTALTRHRAVERVGRGVYRVLQVQPSE